MGQPSDYPMPQVQQQIPGMNLPARTVQYAQEVIKEKAFDQKVKDTVNFVGDTWGWGIIFGVIISGVLGRKQIMSVAPNFKEAIKKWAEKT